MTFSATVLGRLRGEGWGRAIRVLAPLGALLIEGWPELIGTLLVQETGLWLASRVPARPGRPFARQLFLGAFGLRVALALPTHFVSRLSTGNGALFQDDYTNDLVGEWLVRIARGDGTVSIFTGHQHLLDGAYPYLLMGIYAVFGYAPLLPKLLNMGLGALSAVLIYDVAWRVFPRRAAQMAGIGAAVLPSIAIWSVVTLKESLVLFASLVGLWTLQYLTGVSSPIRRTGDALVVLLGVSVVLLDLRSTIAGMLVGLVLLVWLTRTAARVQPGAWRVSLATVAVVVLVGGGLWLARGQASSRPLDGVVEDVVLQIRHRRAQEAASARSQIRPEADVLGPTGSTLPAAEAASDAAPFSFEADVLDPLGYALFAPAPWQVRGPLEIAASAEMVIWYVLLAASPFAWRAAAGQRVFIVCLVVYGVGNWLVLAASEGNLGNLLRHRLMLDPVLLILGSAGAVELARRHAFARRGQPVLSHQDVAE